MLENINSLFTRVREKQKHNNDYMYYNTINLAIHRNNEKIRFTFQSAESVQHQKGAETT